MSRPPTFDHLNSQKKPQFRYVWLPLDSDLADEFAEAEFALEQARNRAQVLPEDEKAQKDLVAAQERHDSTREELKAKSVKFVLRSLGPKKFDRLVTEHQATDEQQEQAKNEGDGSPYQWNPDTFPAVLVAACAVEPALTAEDCLSMLGEESNWTKAEFDQLFMAAMQVNTFRRQVNLGKG